MALPIMAPAATPPRIPAPTAQPTQSAFAGAGAATAAKPNAAAGGGPTSDLGMCFPFGIGGGPIWDVDRRKSPNPPNSRRTRRNSRATLWRKLGAENRHHSQVGGVSAKETPQPVFIRLAHATSRSDAGADPSVAVPYPPQHAGWPVGIRRGIDVLAR